MAVRIQVKGFPEDFELIGSDAKPGRIFDVEVIEVFDNQGIILYAIPYSNIRFIQGIESANVPRSVGNNRKTAAYIIGDTNGDFVIEAERFAFNRPLNEISMDLFTINASQELIREFTIPFENIRYIDYNIAVAIQEEPVKKENSDTEPSNRPTFKQKPRK